MKNPFKLFFTCHQKSDDNFLLENAKNRMHIEKEKYVKKLEKVNAKICTKFVKEFKKSAFDRNGYFHINVPISINEHSILGSSDEIRSYIIKNNTWLNTSEIKLTSDYKAHCGIFVSITVKLIETKC
jgi:hypothetical protein